MSSGATRFTPSSRTRSSRPIGIHSTPASRTLRTAAWVNLRPSRTIVSPSSLLIDLVTRWPSSFSGAATFFISLRPSILMISGA